MGHNWKNVHLSLIILCLKISPHTPLLELILSFWKKLCPVILTPKNLLCSLSIVKKHAKNQNGNKFWFLLVVVLVGIIGANHLLPNKTSSKFPLQMNLNKFRGTEVEVASVVLYSPYQQQTTEREILTSSGYAIAQKKVVINSEVTQKLVEVAVQQGQQVQKNQLLARLDSGRLQLDIQTKKEEIAQSLILEKKDQAALEQIDSELKKTKKTIKQVQEELERSKQQVEQSLNSVKENVATRAEKEVSYQQSQKDLERFKKLYEQNTISLEDYETRQNKIATLKSSIEATEHRINQSKNNYQSALSQVKLTQTKLEITQIDIQTILVQKKVAQAQLQSSQQQTKILKSQLEQLEWDLSRFDLKAPWEGLVTSEVQTVGSMLSSVGGSSGVLSNNYLCEIVDPTSIVAETDIAETYIHKIQPQQEVLIQLDALPDQKFEGVVARVIPIANKQKAAIQVKIKFKKLPPQILHQMSLRTTFLRPKLPSKNSTSEDQDQKPKLMIPKDAVLPDQNSVWVYSEGKAERRTIQTGQSFNDRIEILTGLTEGEQVILKQDLEENQTVFIK